MRKKAVTAADTLSEAGRASPGAPGTRASLGPSVAPSPGSGACPQPALWSFLCRPSLGHGYVAGLSCGLPCFLA